MLAPEDQAKPFHISVQMAIRLRRKKEAFKVIVGGGDVVITCGVGCRCDWQGLWLSGLKAMLIAASGGRRGNGRVDGGLMWRDPTRFGMDPCVRGAQGCCVA